MRKLILLLVLVVVLSGCIGQNGTTTSYKNDIITVEDYSVSTVNPYVGSTTTIEFAIKNNGDKAVNEVEVNFFDTPGFEVVSIDCDGKIKEGQTKCDQTDFGSIESLDFRTISLTLKAISSGAYTVSYSVDYEYSGFRKADIPIVDGITRKEPIAEFSQSTSTYGPVTLTFEPPVGKERKQGSTTIKEYWIVGNNPFEIKMNFKHVGSSSVGSIQPINIAAGNVNLDLRGSLVIGQSDGIELSCDFSEYNNLLFSDKELEVPGTLTCNLQPASTVELETMATIWAEFSYNYKYINTEAFNVQAIEEE